MADSGRDIFDGPCWYCGARFGQPCIDGSECDPAVHNARHTAEVAALQASLDTERAAHAATRAAARRLAEAVRRWDAAVEGDGRPDIARRDAIVALAAWDAADHPVSP